MTPEVPAVIFPTKMVICAFAVTVAVALAIVDPPRTGMAPSVFRALRAAARIDAVVYVSCNPQGFRLRNDFVIRGGAL